MLASSFERNRLFCKEIAHSSIAGHSKTLADLSAHLIRSLCRVSYPSSTARDQHHPASSRAIAVLDTTARFLRVSNQRHRACRR